MKIEDKRNNNKSKYAKIGDMIITNKNNRYLLLSNVKVNEKCSIAFLHVNNNCINCTTCRSIFSIGEDLMNEVITEIIPGENLKLVIE